MACHNNYRGRWKNDLVTEKDRVYFRFSDPVYKRLHRKKNSWPNKMRTENKTKNSSRIKIIEVASSCCGFLYVLYRCKVHPAPLAVSAHKEFSRRSAKRAAGVTRLELEHWEELGGLYKPFFSSYDWAKLP